MAIAEKTKAPQSSAIGRKLDLIREHAGLNDREIAQLLGATPQTVSRWRTSKAEPHRRTLDRLLSLAWLAEELAELFDPDEARLWLFSPHRLLRGARPADRVAGDRVDDALSLLAQLRDGAYT